MKTGNASLDLGTVAARVDLGEVLSADLGMPKVIGGKPHWCCPWHDDANPSLYLWADGRRWRCWPCGIEGDALDYLSRREGCTVAEAARMVAGRGEDVADRRPRRGVTDAEPAPTPPTEAWRDAAWQATADGLIRRADATLWGPDGRDALAWLRSRGLADHTIQRFRLGFMPDRVETPPLDCLTSRQGHPRGIGCARGIVIPWVRPGSWYSEAPDPDGADPGPRWVGANVRRLMPDVLEPWPGKDKYMALDGSTRGHPYPWSDVMPGVETLIVEGELDALLAFQELGHVVNVMTVGGASQSPQPEALSALAGCPEWLVATDHDPPGDKAARRFAALNPRKSHRAWLPHGNDLGEFVESGGNALAWLAVEFDRLGWRWPFRTPDPPPQAA